MTVRIVLADDHSVVRAGFKMLLEQDGSAKVVGEAAEGTQAYAVVARERPDVLLLDISMPPGQSGLVACEDIHRDFPDVRIIIVTMFAEPEYLYYTLRGGASGYLLKNASADEMCEAVRTVMGGGVYVHPSMSDYMANEVSDERKESAKTIQALTPREMEVLQLLAKGHTNKEISEIVFLSVKTIEAHRAKIYSKLGFQSRADLVAYAIEHKLLSL